MGLFGNKKKAEEEEQRILAERKEQERQNQIEEAKAAHASLHWPTNPRINRLNVKDAENLTIEDPLTSARKDEVGVLIYEPNLKADDVQGLTLQELLFLHAAHLLYNREAALVNYESNHRVIYNELLNRIHAADELYVIFDKVTGFPLIDGGFVNVYLERAHAEKASEIYNSQMRKTGVVTRPGEDAQPLENGKHPISLFDYLYYIGAENVMIDNGWYKAPIKRSEISAPIGFGADPAKTPPTNPTLAFAMTDFVQEISWPVKYDQRDEIVKKKQERMFAALKNAKFVVPTTVADAADNAEGKPKKEVKFPIINAKEQKFLPVFTDLFEYSKNRKPDDGFKPAGFDFKNVVTLIGAVDGILINCNGQKIVVPKSKCVSLAAELTK